jgi:hypothetical protein
MLKTIIICITVLVAIHLLAPLVFLSMFGLLFLKVVGMS